jgi:hypothetical protein
MNFTLVQTQLTSIFFLVKPCQHTINHLISITLAQQNEYVLQIIPFTNSGLQNTIVKKCLIKTINLFTDSLTVACRCIQNSSGCSIKIL